MNIKKILIITQDYPPPFGGIATVTKTLEAELSKHGYDVKVLNFDARNTCNYKHLRIRDFFYTPATQTYYYSFSQIFNPIKFIDLNGGFRDFVYHNLIYRVSKKTIEEFVPDVIHIMHLKLYSAIYGIRFKTVLTCHSEELKPSFPVLYSINNVNKIHCVSNYSKNKVLSISQNNNQEKITVIHNPINLNAYYNFRQVKRKRQIVILSRLEKHKNINCLIHAIYLLPDSIRNKYKICILGEGKERQKLEALVEKLELKNIVNFYGEISERQKISILCHSSLFLLCPKRINSEEEGFGIVFLEAQAAGLPIVTSKNGGIQEAVGNAGLYVNNPEDPKEISRKIFDVLSNQKLYQNLSQEAKKNVMKFAKEKWINKIIKLYEE